MLEKNLNELVRGMTMFLQHIFSIRGSIDGKETLIFVNHQQSFMLKHLVHINKMLHMKS